MSKVLQIPFIKLFADDWQAVPFDVLRVITPDMTSFLFYSYKSHRTQMFIWSVLEIDTISQRRFQW